MHKQNKFCVICFSGTLKACPTSNGEVGDGMPLHSFLLGSELIGTTTTVHIKKSRKCVVSAPGFPLCRHLRLCVYLNLTEEKMI